MIPELKMLFKEKIMKRNIFFFMAVISVVTESALADWPRYVQCPNINFIDETTGSNNSKHGGFTLYNSSKNEIYRAEKFVGANLNSTYTFSCYYVASDGTDVTAKFDLSKCSEHHGFDNSGKCNNSDPDQCIVVCSY
jgi:hypothetical protein